MPGAGADGAEGPDRARTGETRRTTEKIVLTDKSRHIAEVLRDNAKNMERILLEGLEDDQIRQFMHVLDIMQTNLVKTGLIGDESRYPSLEIQEQDASKSQVPQESQVPQKHAMTMPRIIAMLVMSTSRTYCGYRRKWRLRNRK